MSKVNTKVSTKSKVEMEDDEEEDLKVMTRVNIDDKYYFKMTSRQYILYKESIVTKKDGTKEIGETFIGYYATPEGIFKRYFREQVNIKIRNKTLSLLDFKSVMLDVAESIRQIAKSLDIEITIK